MTLKQEKYNKHTGLKKRINSVQTSFKEERKQEKDYQDILLKVFEVSCNKMPHDNTGTDKANK